MGRMEEEGVELCFTHFGSQVPEVHPNDGVQKLTLDFWLVAPPSPIVNSLLHYSDVSPGSPHHLAHYWKVLPSLQKWPRHEREWIYSY